MWGGGGGYWRFGQGRGVPKVGGPARDPLPHAYLQGGCVSGGLGVWRYVCDNKRHGNLALKAWMV